LGAHYYFGGISRVAGGVNGGLVGKCVDIGSIWVVLFLLLRYVGCLFFDIVGFFLLMVVVPSVFYSFIVCLEIRNCFGMFGCVILVIG